MEQLEVKYRFPEGPPAWPSGLCLQLTNYNLGTCCEVHDYILSIYTCPCVHIFSYTNISPQHNLTRAQYASNQNWLMEPIWPAHCTVKRLRRAWKKLCGGNWRMLRINVCSIGCAGVLCWWINDEEEEGPCPAELFSLGKLCVCGCVCLCKADRIAGPDGFVY